MQHDYLNHVSPTAPNRQLKIRNRRRTAHILDILQWKQKKPVDCG